MNIKKLVKDLEDIQDSLACKSNQEDGIEKLGFVLNELKLTKEYKKKTETTIPIELTKEYTNRIKRDEALVDSFSSKSTARKYIKQFLAYLEEEYNMKITLANYMLLAYKKGKFTNAKRKKY